MNDTVITAAFKRRELKIWAVCFVAAILVNAGAILWFGTHWVELFTQIGYVVVYRSCFMSLSPECGWSCGA